MILHTERMELVLLTPNQLVLWAENIAALNKELKCVYAAEPVEGFFLSIVKGQIIKAQNDPENYLFHSFFFIIRKSDRTVVGTVDFKNPPNENGEVEIGYGLGKAYEHNGYMTEAVKGMCEFAANHQNIKNVIAETDLNGFASQRILERCGFKKYREEKSIWWKL